MHHDSLRTPSQIAFTGRTSAVTLLIVLFFNVHSFEGKSVFVSHLSFLHVIQVYVPTILKISFFLVLLVSEIRCSEPPDLQIEAARLGMGLSCIVEYSSPRVGCKEALVDCLEYPRPETE